MLASSDGFLSILPSATIAVMRALSILCALCWAGQASADGESTALAQSLFEEGRTLMSAGNYAEACPKLEESQRLDPGGGTLLNLASCHEKQGRTATAWAEYNEAASIARRDGRTDREREATARVQALEPLLRRVTVAVDPKNPVALDLTLDGRKLPGAAWGSAIPLDPGSHELVASAAGRETWKHSFELAKDGEIQPISVPELTLAPEEPPPVAAPLPKLEKPKEQQPETDRKPTSAGPPLSTWVAGSVAVVGFGIGTWFGLRALDEKSKSDDRCKGDACSPDGLEYNEDAQRDAWISNAGIGVGVVATGLAAYFWLSADPHSEDTARRAPRVGIGMRRGGGTLGMRGTFW